MVEVEQRLRPAGVQPGVAAVDVDRDRGVVHGGELRRQQLAVHLLGGREQPGDRDLALTPFVGGIEARRRVETQRARRQQALRVVRLELNCLGPLLPVRERHGEGGGIAMALQVHPVAADPQRMVDLQPVGLPGAGLQIGPGLVVDIRRERGGLPRRQVLGLKVVDPDAHRVQRGAVHVVAGPEGVVGRRRCRAESGPAVGDDDDIALVAEQLADRDGGQQAQQREVEDDVAELAQIALLRGYLDDIALGAGDPPPAAQLLGDPGGDEFR